MYHQKEQNKFDQKNVIKVAEQLEIRNCNESSCNSDKELLHMSESIVVCHAEKHLFEYN